MLAEHYPPTFSRYIEPFMGSAAVFFDLLNSGRLARRAIVLADVNPDLIGCYRMLRDRPEAVIRALNGLARGYRISGTDHYYEVRDTRFNPLRAALQARASAPGDVADMYTPGLAAMLIFLNRTGFNGLFRLNRSGGFNVPAGRYTNPRICDEAHLRSVAAALATPGVTIALQPFDRTLDDAGAGDFVYCDPPYAPLSRTSSFANYTADGFTGIRSASPATESRCRMQARRACRRLEFECGRDPGRTDAPKRRGRDFRFGRFPRGARSTPRRPHAVRSTN